MSRAFIKEQDGDSGGDALPERAKSGQPNYVTALGLADLRRKLDQALAERARQERLPDAPGTKSALARLAREARYLEHRIESAIVVEPRDNDEEIRVGATVTIDDGANVMKFTVVGEDQADPVAGLISWSSPLGRALVGAKRGAKVRWERPAGDVTVTVVDFTY